MKVSNMFVREFRKQFLAPDGGPQEGQEKKAAMLLAVHKAMQSGAYRWAMGHALKHGLDLERMYTEHRALASEARAAGSNWKYVEANAKKFGIKSRLWNLSPVTD